MLLPSSRSGHCSCGYAYSHTRNCTSYTRTCKCVKSVCTDARYAHSSTYIYHGLRLKLRTLNGCTGSNPERTRKSSTVQSKFQAWLQTTDSVLTPLCTPTVEVGTPYRSSALFLHVCEHGVCRLPLSKSFSNLYQCHVNQGPSLHSSDGALLQLRRQSHPGVGVNVPSRNLRSSL